MEKQHVKYQLVLKTDKIRQVKTHSIINTYNESDYDSNGRLKPQILDKELDNDFNRLVS